MRLYLINHCDKVIISGYRKSEKVSGLVKVVDNLIEKMTDKTSNLIRNAGECEQIEIHYGSDKEQAIKNYNNIVSRTIKKNAILLGVNSTLALLSYIPPFTVVPLISVSLVTMAINNYSLISRAKKSQSKAEFLFNNEISVLEKLLKSHDNSPFGFCDKHLQELYNRYTNTKSL